MILVCDERDHPYERPPLSKGYLLGKEERDSVFVHEPAWYARPTSNCTSASPSSPSTATQGASASATARHPLRQAALATGAEPRRLDVPGTDLAGVHHLRRLAHADRLTAGPHRPRARQRPPGDRRRLWIGLEIAAAASEYGAEVTVVERDATPLHAVLGPEVGQMFADLHAEHGVRFHFGAALTEIVGQDGMVLAARTDDGEEHPAHDVLAAIGAAPRTALAEAAGLVLADGADGGGIAVDAAFRTSDPDIFAAGDVAAMEHPLFGTRLRVEHWANALNGGPAAARAMLGQDVVHDRVPYFFSDQYDVGLEYSGWAPPGSYDQVVVRGDTGKREFIAFWLREGRVLAGMNVNVWDVTETVQKLIHSGARPDVHGLSDPGTPLASLIA
ncbi:NAD(P)/FAD-dependent oxidoreductase OS=Streptomyces alboniger OX=132473 GN=CP975_11060 PE=4 SV=1 [Streptomyces alboniger]